MIGKEIEYKYRADKIHVLDFIQFCKSSLGIDFKMARGHDYFYNTRTKKDAFCRHRIGEDLNQLTFKEKLTDNNNYVRVEHNIPLGEEARPDDINRLLTSMGYNHSLTLQKQSFIFQTDTYTVVYYVCRDEDNKLLGRFIELELAENVDWKTTKNALKELRKIEKQFMLLGISPKKRVKQSLWELYRRK